MNMRAIQPQHLPMILRNLRQVKIDKFGYPTINSRLVKDGSRDLRHFIPIPNSAVWEYELYFADSYRLYGIEYVRARDQRTAKRKIKKLHPNVIKFKWNMLEEE